jgi:two-component system chemotaxis response regulator CheB
MGGPTTSSDLGVPAALGCPECQGGMFESLQEGTVTYACHVGHSWSGQSLLEAERQAVEAAIYNASSKLLEMAAVHRRLAELHADPSGNGRNGHLAAARAAEDRAERIRRLATDDPDPG